LTEESYIRWIEPLDNLVFQAWYRVLSFVSIHAPITEVYDAAKYIATTHRGGDLYWVIKGFVARWEGLDVNPPHGVKMSIWLWGIPSGKNTILTRAGWWTLYLFESAKRAQKTLTSMATAGFFERQETEP